MVSLRILILEKFAELLNLKSFLISESFVYEIGGRSLTQNQHIWIESRSVPKDC